MDHTKPKRSRWDYLFLTLIIVAVTAVALNRYGISDWWYFRSYSPSSAVIRLADDAGLNSTGRRLLYRGNPQFVDRAVMDQVCAPEVIGCLSTGGQIYILSDSQGKYHDENIVTAAHEMLHLAYRRLSRSDRENANQLIDTAASAITDGSLDQVIQKTTDNTDKLDELHSVLGTTKASLTPGLESYYERYFSQRSKVVAAYQRSL